MASKKNSGTSSLMDRINQIYNQGYLGSRYTNSASNAASNINKTKKGNLGKVGTKPTGATGVTGSGTATFKAGKENTTPSADQEAGEINSSAVVFDNPNQATDNSNGSKSEKIDVSLFVPNSATDDQKDFYHQVNIFNSEEFTKGLFTQRYRYGVLNPYQSLTVAREILFFTKPELNIYRDGGGNSEPDYEYDSNTNLNMALYNNNFFLELHNKYPEILYALQASADKGDNPFNNLLGNMVQSTLDVPSTTADMIETPANVYGVSYKYRGSSEAGDDNHSFSLEFKDTKYLPVYNFFKAYDIYEILKHHGAVRPKNQYIMNKVLHDQYSIYKFILDEDMETIIFFAKYYGVKSLNLPRDVFNSTTFDNGLSYSIDFDAAFVEDSNPQILYDFNSLAYDYWSSLSEEIPVFNITKGQPDMRSAKCAIIVREKSGDNFASILGKDAKIEYTNPNPLNHVPGGIVYKLKWRGDQKV